MINQVVLVGRCKEIQEYDEFKKNLLIEIERPFKDGNARVHDLVECLFWESVFYKDIKFYKKGDLVAIKGRLERYDSKCMVNIENISLLNKSINNISKCN